MTSSSLSVFLLLAIISVILEFDEYDRLIELMKFIGQYLLFNNRKFVRWPHLRYSHCQDEHLPMKKLNIISYAPAECRNSLIAQIETAVTTCGGYIDDFNFFSDLAISLRILGLKQPDTLKHFFQKLISDVQGLRLDNETIKILKISSFNSADRYTLFILFQILFIDAKGELRQTVPAVNN